LRTFFQIDPITEIIGELHPQSPRGVRQEKPKKDKERQDYLSGPDMIDERVLHRYPP
jgi:hypothetical protein